MTFMLISGSCFVVSLLWYTAEKFLARKSDPSQINTIASSDDGLTPEQRQRKWLLEMRGKMEIAVKNAAGTPVSVIFEKSPPTKQITMMFDNKEYQIGTSMCGATSVWIYGSPPSVRSYTVKTAVKDRPIDVRSLRENRDSDAIQIGERAFFKFDDGRTAQLLLVGVQYYAAGDDIDEARFKYKIYEEGEFLIDPL